MLRIIQELWRTSGGAFNVDVVLTKMVRGLSEELDARVGDALAFEQSISRPSQLNPEIALILQQDSDDDAPRDPEDDATALETLRREVADLEAKWHAKAIKETDKPEAFRAKPPPKKVKKPKDVGAGTPSREWLDRKFEGSKLFARAQRTPKNARAPVVVRRLRLRRLVLLLLAALGDLRPVPAVRAAVDPGQRGERPGSRDRARRAAVRVRRVRALTGARLHFNNRLRA